MVMVKVAVDERTRSELDSIVAAFRAHVVDIGPRAVTVELTGDSEKIKAFIALVRPLGIKEIVRSGKIAMARAVQHEPRQSSQPSARAKLNNLTAENSGENQMKVYYDRDADLSALSGQEDRDHRLWKPGTCACAQPARQRNGRTRRTAQGQPVVREGRPSRACRCSTPPRPRKERRHHHDAGARRDGLAKFTKPRSPRSSPRASTWPSATASTSISNSSSRPPTSMSS